MKRMGLEDSSTNTARAKSDYILNIEKQFLMMEKVLEPTHVYDRAVEINVAMRDGIKLLTTVYFPQGEGPWPVILERSPYPQLIPVLERTSKQYTKYGYVFVSQQCRGKGASEGNWAPFANERNDGIDTIYWIIRQSWMNGNMALYGHSYGGFEQWIVADLLPPEVKTLFIGVFGTERYRQMYMNGMFRHEIYTSWAIENSGVTVQGDLGQVYQQALHVKPHVDMDVELLGQQLPWYREWVTEVDRESEYWQTGLWAQLSRIPEEIRIPLFMVGGWYDHHLDGMVRGYKKLPEKVREESRFVIGPWIHTLQPGGDLEYPNSEFLNLVEAVNWFNHHLKGERYLHSKGVVETYFIRDAVWKIWEGWMEGNDTATLYLHSHRSDEDKALSLCFNVVEPSLATFQYDPEKPVRTIGGEALLAWISPGFHGARPSSILQDKPGTRQDVISFLTERLQADMRISGAVKVYLSVASDAEDTSFTVKISEVCPDGNSYNIRDGITSIAYRNEASQPQKYESGQVVQLEIELWPITWTLKKGSKLRLDVSSSNFPAYHIHSNVAGAWALQQNTRIANQQIHLGRGNRSCIEIPIVKD